MLYAKKTMPGIHHSGERGEGEREERERGRREM